MNYFLTTTNSHVHHHYATATLEQLKSVIKTKVTLDQDIRDSQTMTQWKRCLYGVSKEKTNLLNTTFALIAYKIFICFLQLILNAMWKIEQLGKLHFILCHKKIRFQNNCFSADFVRSYEIFPHKFQFPVNQKLHVAEWKCVDVMPCGDPSIQRQQHCRQTRNVHAPSRRRLIASLVV